MDVIMKHSKKTDQTPAIKRTLLYRYPQFATSKQRWEFLLNCIAEKGGPATWSAWIKKIEKMDMFVNIVGSNLVGRFIRWRQGERKAFNFVFKMAILSPIASELKDKELAWSAYWLESGCEPVSVRGSKSHHVFTAVGRRPILITEPDVPECHGGANIHDKHLAIAHMKFLEPKGKRGRPSKTEHGNIPQITSNGIFDFPPWYQRISYQRQRDLQHIERWKQYVTRIKKETGKEFSGEMPPSPDVTDQISNSIKTIGRGVLVRIAEYFKNEKIWRKYSPLYKELNEQEPKIK